MTSSLEKLLLAGLIALAFGFVALWIWCRQLEHKLESLRDHAEGLHRMVGNLHARVVLLCKFVGLEVEEPPVPEVKKP